MDIQNQTQHQSQPQSQQKINDNRETIARHQSLLDSIEAIGIVPVIKLDRVEDAVPLAAALQQGGIPVAEITFRTAAAEASIAAVRQALPDVIVGAGTVINRGQVDAALNAGAQFIVTPGFDPEVVAYCQEKGALVIPGCTNPSEISKAINMGLEVVKFFPAEASGGLPMIKALSGPFAQVRFMPTGGIDEKNLNDYLSFNKVVACGGSWMVSDALIKAGEFNAIAKKAEAAVLAMLGFELGHVGINCDNSDEAEGLSTLFTTFLGMEPKPGASSIFIGSAIELMRTPYLGAKGHIAIRTKHIHRAMKYLESKGFDWDASTAKWDGEHLKAIYCTRELGGFAIHLLQA